jgi:hypothetical protein
VKRVLILVEGQTEETFVRDMLMPHLISAHNVYPTPVLATTKIVKSGPNFKGGLISYGKTRPQILRLLGDRDAAAVTTMFDVYGLPEDFPDYAARPRADCYAKVAHLENALARDINHPRFKPYLQLHEFETFLYVNPAETNAWLPGVDILADLLKIRADFNSPEEINDYPDTAPSKRLLKLFTRYQKTLYGPLVVKNIGLAQIRRACSHFEAWLVWLERLGQT